MRCTTLGAPVSLALNGRVWILTRRVPEHPVLTLSTCHPNRDPHRNGPLPVSQPSAPENPAGCFSGGRSVVSG
jgi:hypothetical protein